MEGMEIIFRMYCAATVWLAPSVEPLVSARRYFRRFVGTSENYPADLGPLLTSEPSGNCREIAISLTDLGPEGVLSVRALVTSIIPNMA
jgi:hypothetical protein